MNKLGKLLNLIFVVLVICIGSSCSYNKESKIDPYESFNRKIFAFNSTVDKVIVRPVAKVYDEIVPDTVEKRVKNVFTNFGEVTVIGNDILQLDILQAVSDFWRLAFNSTIGIGGIFDVASDMGLPKNKQYFGKTLAFWGFDDSPYLVLPFLGPSTVYDTISIPIDNNYLSLWPYIKPSSTQYQLRALDVINIRSSALDFDHTVREAFDPYIFVRNAYLQNREEFNKYQPYLEEYD